MMIPHPGKILVLIGMIIAVIGMIMILSGKMPWLGRLPGDFYFKGKNLTFYFPLATSLLISLVLTLIIWLIGRK